ncbi:MAG: hypothetical protein HYY18_12150 [Planctomycetes bacterium]|nr:hypothetical protein [Planctomycetota bacterium]
MGLSPLEWVEGSALLAGLGAAFAVPHAGRKFFRAAAQRFDGFARRRAASVAAVGLLSFLGSAAFGFLVRLPEPSVHDEFAYVLLGDTFASGRLANPQHPLWPHFETMHVLHEPAYAAKFPVAQGLFLAAGQALSGDPIVGVWLGAALACAALTWMLQAWLPPRWALLGGILAVLHFGIVGYWAQSYWGGAPAVLGGALLFGGLRRAWDRPAIAPSLALGAGLALLANSRPYEGLVAALPAAVALGWRTLRRPPAGWWPRLVLPVAGVLLVTGAAMLHYNRTVTGSALRMPYQAYQSRYAVASPWWFLRDNPVRGYRTDAMRQFHEGWELGQRRKQSTLAGAARATPWKLYQIYQFPFRMFLVFPLAALPWAWRRPWLRLAAATCAALLAALLALTWVQPHYVAPAAGLLLVLFLHALRLLRARGPAGRAFARLVPFACAAGFAAHLFAPRLDDFGIVRSNVAQQLEELQGKQLVLVSYGPEHSEHLEWVYNRADIDASQTVWARARTNAENARLLEYFRDRRPWSLRIEHDGDPPKLEPILR